MKTSRTLQQIIDLNYIEYNHWQLICDLANNDYDISYFGGRVTANNNFIEFLLTLEQFDINEIINYLDAELADVKNQNEIYKNENSLTEPNENYIGYSDELEFLLNYVKLNYK